MRALWRVKLIKDYLFIDSSKSCVNDFDRAIYAGCADVVELLRKLNYDCVWVLVEHKAFVSRTFKCNEIKLQICKKVYNNNLHMLLNSSAFFEIYVSVFFFKKFIFLFNTRSHGRMRSVSTFSNFYPGKEASYPNFTRVFWIFFESCCAPCSFFFMGSFE